mgnify:CR=1 FL=1
MNGKIFNLEELFRSGKERLREAQIEEADLDAWYLLEYITGVTKTAYYGNPKADVPEEQRAIGQISQQLLRRCRMLVVCGNEITTAMAGEIGTAEKLKLICTTLDGLAKIKDAEQRYIN